MGRETSPYIVGDYWLDKRWDGKPPHIWQIAGYDAATQSIVYQSTRARELEGTKGAKAKILAHVEKIRAAAPQSPTDAKVIPLLALYWEEHGQNVGITGPDCEFDTMLHRLPCAGRCRA